MQNEIPAFGYVFKSKNPNQILCQSEIPPYGYVLKSENPIQILYAK
jgi:hypothetical protein